MTYQELLNITLESSAVREDSPPARWDELEIQSHWFAGHFAEKFTANHGQEVRIISVGEWNRGAGPDFIEATVSIDGVQHHGPIELDLDSRNWDLHGHSQNSDFDAVILHVVLYDTKPTYFTRTSNHREIPRVLLAESTIREALGRPRLSQALARPGLCLKPLAEMPEVTMIALLEEAARHRAHIKATRFHRTAAQHSFSQALWETFADSLGFASNRLPMRLLAQRLPVRALAKFSQAESEAILFGSAGFLSPKLHETAPPDSRKYLASLWTDWWKHRAQFEFPEDRFPVWKASGSRPGNHPQRRLAALSQALHSWGEIASHSNDPAPWNKLKKHLQSLEHQFWTNHHTLKSDRTPAAIRLLGENRITEFFINTLYPIVIDEDKSAWAAYQKLRGSAPNQKLKRCAERLFGSQEKAKPYLKFAWQQQALLQIYQDFCLEDRSDCENCPFPEQLGQWS